MTEQGASARRHSRAPPGASGRCSRRGIGPHVRPRRHGHQDGGGEPLELRGALLAQRAEPRDPHAVGFLALAPVDAPGPSRPHGHARGGAGGGAALLLPRGQRAPARRGGSAQLQRAHLRARFGFSSVPIRARRQGAGGCVDRLRGRRPDPQAGNGVLSTRCLDRGGLGRARRALSRRDMEDADRGEPGPASPSTSP